jgi:hypothetical protein
MLGMSMNEQNHGSKELLMLSVLALRMTLELVKVMVLPCGRDDLGNCIVLLSWIEVVANRLAAPPLTRQGIELINDKGMCLP